MKHLILPIFILFFHYTNGQIYKGEIQAAGLTCAMCSNAIYKSLKTLTFIEEVDVDLNRSSFMLSFKQREEVNFDAIRLKVEDAGFSLSSFVFSINLNDDEWADHKPLRLSGSLFCLLNFPNTPVKNKNTFKVVNRGFISEKDYKKYIKDIAADVCSEKVQNEKLYYVTFAEKSRTL